MKTKIIYKQGIPCLYLCILLLLSACGDDALLQGFPGNAVEIQIAPLSINAGTRAPADQKTAWEKDDKVYMYLVFFDNMSIEISATRVIGQYTGTGWTFTTPVIPPAGAKTIQIDAYYIGNFVPGEEVTDTDMLHCRINGIPLQSIIVLDNFRHQYSYFTFTNLLEGDVVTFPGVYVSLDTNLSYITGGGAPMVTADAKGNASAYAYVNSTINFTITRGTTAKVFNYNSTPTEGWHYIIDCSHLWQQGGMDLED